MLFFLAETEQAWARMAVVVMPAKASKQRCESCYQEALRKLHVSRTTGYIVSSGVSFREPASQGVFYVVCVLFVVCSCLACLRQ